jgi:alpha-D-ribose 1-methylphosphonate 5-triphosphate synthase subunit PhnG
VRAFKQHALFCALLLAQKESQSKKVSSKVYAKLEKNNTKREKARLVQISS